MASGYELAMLFHDDRVEIGFVQYTCHGEMV
jgi:hypothetical protein